MGPVNLPLPPVLLLLVVTVLVAIGIVGRARGEPRLILAAVAVGTALAGFELASALKFLTGGQGDLLFDPTVLLAIIYAPLILIAIGAWFIARRAKPGIAGSVTVVVAAFLVGSLGGAIIAPGYVYPRQYPGTLALRVDAPLSLTASGPAECQSIPNGTDFSIAMANGLTGLGPHFVRVTVSIRAGLAMDLPGRQDRTGLIIAEHPPLGEVTEPQGSFGVFEADDSAELSVTTEGAGGQKGSMTFSKLRQTQGTEALGFPHTIVLSGTVSWTCDPSAR
jgi:hypothetical protein